jgi:hypothetical protein
VSDHSFPCRKLYIEQAFFHFSQLLDAFGRFTDGLRVAREFESNSLHQRASDGVDPLRRKAAATLKRVEYLPSLRASRLCCNLLAVASPQIINH